MGNPSPGWAVEILGDSIDLEDFREMLPAPFDPWVEEFISTDGRKLLLRSKRWENLADATMVDNDALGIIARLNGEAVLLHSDAHPIVTGGVIKFNADGKREYTLIALTGHLSVKSRARATLSVNDVAFPAGPSQMQKWFEGAESDLRREELFIHLGHADNWFDIYKCMELAERVAETKKLRNSAEWRRVRQTANHYRHAPGNQNTLPPNPPKLMDARRFVIDTIVSVL